jgi:DNA-binding MarR family transcriptional regulator
VHPDFRPLLVEFIRRFGLLATDRTPCGKPVAPSEAHALMYLREVGEATQGEVAARLGLDKSTVSRLVARLVERGQATATVGADARARIVRLTRKGLTLAAAIADASGRRFAALLEHVPARRREPLVAALRDLVAAMDGLDPDPKSEGSDEP